MHWWQRRSLSEKISFTIFVTCDGCKAKNYLVRPIAEPTVFWMVCHECEKSVRVDITQSNIESWTKQWQETKT